MFIKNIPRRITQAWFLDELNRWGFAGKYDYAYLPWTRTGALGFGLVNFTEPSVAERFAAE